MTETEKYGRLMELSATRESLVSMRGAIYASHSYPESVRKYRVAGEALGHIDRAIAALNGLQTY